MKCLHIVYATDSRYLFPTLVAAASAVLHASDRRRIAIDILDCGLSETEWASFVEGFRRQLGTDFALTRHLIDMQAYDEFKAWHTSRGIYARLDIPQILPNEDWCVYADGDTLFTSDPLALAEVFDPTYAIMGHLDDNVDIPWYGEHGFRLHPETQICAGFILLNLDWFRRNDGTRKCFELLSHYPDMPYNDQDALNIVCEGKIGVLPDNWGKFTYNTNRETVPGCFHYVSDRPWELGTNGFLPLRGTDVIWYRIKALATGADAHSCPTTTKVRYFHVWAKTAFVKTVVILLNALPGLRGRFSHNLRRTWSDAFISRFLPRS
ncbi:MAG: hypothetical protein MJ240_02645 [Kiritimatiellae bacterium]|nr:hypothetical protein [Kiritimatiellia bacterium]